MKYRLLCCAALLSLAACGKSEEQKGGKQSAEDVATEMSALKMEPGQWEATNEILSATAPGLPPQALRQMVGQKTTVSNCVTPEQAEKPDANFLSGQKDSNCTYQDFSMQGGKMTGKVSCTGGQMPGKTVMTMDGSYTARNYDMNMTMEAQDMPGGMNMTIRARTTGRRTGECTAEGGSAK